MSENLQKILEIFYQICEIPHPSGQTQILREFLIDFLRACGCEVKTDSAGNIHALKGTPDVVFQAHYDMVLVGEEVAPYIQGDLLKSRNSSLGADNGIAVALLLHFAKTRKNIEILLTNDEEIGMLGAKNLTLQTRSKMMINLDSECINEICVGCAGGFDVDIDLGNLSWGMRFRTCEKFWESADFSPALSQNFSQIQKPHRHYFDCDSLCESTANQIQNAESTLDSANSQNLGGNSPIHCHSERSEESQKNNQNRDSSVASLPQNDNVKKSQNDKVGARGAESVLDSAFYEFSAHNFKGGHSGIDIDKNIKNAIVELLFALDSVREMGEFEILEISGGEARNSIPINARAVIATKAPINLTHSADSAPHIAIKKLTHYTPKQKALKSAVVADLLRLHNGIYEVQEGSVTSSLNFSQISPKTLKIMVRGNKAEFLERQILRLKYLFGEAVEISGFYNAWESAESSAESTLLSTISRIYQKHKIPFNAVQIHAGLECGILKEKCGLDEVVSIGPTILYPHSKNECLNLPSVGQIYEILADLVE